LKTADRDTWDKVFNKSIEETDHTILECLAYIENSEIIMNYLEIKLPTNVNIFWRNLPYHQSKSVIQIETLMSNIFLFTLAKRTKYMLEDTLNDFRKITFIYG